MAVSAKEIPDATTVTSSASFDNRVLESPDFFEAKVGECAKVSVHGCSASTRRGVGMRVAVVSLCVLTASAVAAAQAPDSGQQVFVSRCAGCHGTDGNGGELGPNIATRVPTRTDEELATVLRQGLIAARMPAFTNLSDGEVGDVVRFLRTLRPRSGMGPSRTKVTLAGGHTLEGLAVNQSAVDLQMLGDDRRIHLLRKSGDQYRRVTSQADWPSYNGGMNAAGFPRLPAAGATHQPSSGRRDRRSRARSLQPTGSASRRNRHARAERR
jgi:mono/diheme cytochrome c family protein